MILGNAYLLALLSGALLPLAFAPYSLWPLAILSPTVLMGLWENPLASPKKCFGLGFFYGLGFFGMGVSWVFVSIHHYGNTGLSLALLLTAVFVSFLALFMATQGFILKRFFIGNRVFYALAGFPSLWVLFEWVRSFLFTGFPWLFLGYSQLEHPLAGYAPIASVYGVSWVVLLSSGALYLFLKERRSIIKLWLSAGMICIWGLGHYCYQYDFTTLHARPYTVSLVQGNIKPLDKFSQQNPIQATEQTYGALTQEEWGSHLILWPESAIPLPYPHATPYLKMLQALALKHHSTLITGIQFINAQDEYHNSLIVLGKGEGFYHKHHLVPFGDFLPFEKILRGLIHFFDLPMSSFTQGLKEQPLLKVGALTLDPLICYEIAFPEQVRKSLRNASALVTLSEDGWFGDSWGPYQHLQIAQMRALETGRYVLRATTSGATAIIGPKGHLVAQAPRFTATVLKGTFQSATGETPWVQWGLWPLLTILILLFLLPGRYSLKD